MQKRVERVVRAGAIAALCAALVTLGCEERSTTPAAPTRAVVKKADVTDHTRLGESNLYGPGNPYALSVVDDLVDRREVSAVVEGLEERGLEVAYEDCVVFEERRGSQVTTAALVVMPPAREGVEETAMIACIERGGDLFVSPATFRASAAARDAGFQRVSDDVWMNSDPLAGAQLSPADAERLDPEFWPRFWKCIQIGAPTVLAGCFVSCTFVAMGYPQCVLVCVASQALTTVVRCMMSTWLIETQGRDFESK